MTPLEEFRDRIAAACPVPRWTTPIPRVGLMRAEAPTEPASVIYEPVVCFAAQGRKRLMLADRAYAYDPAHYLVVSVDLPVIATITEASVRAPYLAMRLSLDAGFLAELMLEMPGTDGPRAAGIGIGRLDADLLDPVLRLLRLVDRPGDATALAPLIEREILYRLLCGPQGPMLRQIALADTRLSQIARAVAWIRENYQQPLRIDGLARLAAMSPATLHRHFRAVTALSPLQYQKQVRLHEARRRMLALQRDAQSVAFEVGYQSPSQFSREYARLFGAPPARDALRLRAEGINLDADTEQGAPSLRTAAT
jgi:AraC-like DNA-binding protein